jgi:predicted  nucleic acid-binding Zn-ribbon protein
MLSLFTNLIAPLILLVMFGSALVAGCVYAIHRIHTREPSTSGKSLKVGLGESIRHMGQEIVNGLGATIPEEERLYIVLNRIATEVDQKRSGYQGALKEIITLQDPDDSTKGKIPALYARIGKLEKKGKEWGGEHDASENDDQRTELMARMQECSVEILALMEQVTSLESALQMWRETAALRRKAWQDAKAEYDRLRLQGSALVAQKAALSAATWEHSRAIQEAGGAKDAGVKNILEGLRQDLEEVRAENKAASTVRTESKRTNVEEEIDAQDRASAAQAYVATWAKA